MRILETQKPVGITNINLADNKIESILEVELFKQIGKLKDEKVKLSIEKARTRITVNITSKFLTKGVLINNFWSKKLYKYLCYL